MDDEIFIAKYVAGRFGTSDLVNFANEKLNKGFFSEHLLNILDEDPKTWGLISAYFELEIERLGYSIPLFDNAIWVLLKHHISLICDGKVRATSQFRELLRDIDNFDLHKGIKEYVGDNIGISLLYGLYHDDYLSIEETDAKMFEESIVWLHEHGSEH